VARSEELQDSPIAVRLLGQRLALFRSAGTPVAFNDLCVHRGTPLSMGRVEDGLLVCAYHGWTYGTDGKCTRIPQRPSSAIPAKARVPRHHVQERYGLIWVCMGTPSLPLSDFPEFEDPTYGTVFVGTHEWQAGAARIMENFLDVGHFAWVHTGLLGDPSRPEVFVSPLERSESGFSYVARTDIPSEDGEWTSEPLDYRLTLPYWFSVVHTQGHTPTTAAGRKAPPLEDSGPHRYRVDIVVQPLSRHESRLYTWISRNYDLDVSLDEAVQFQLKVAAQDRPIVENQRPEELPLDLAEEMHIRDVDAPAVEFRRLLRRVGLVESAD
jgi:phenylpropionate dioxygenase-like ring-hydroxylating dioxygenase large terminal subunit